MFRRSAESLVRESVARRPWRRAALPLGLACVPLVPAALVLSAKGAPGGVAGSDRSADTATAIVEDLRCLTRRPGDCLDEPVPADEPHGAICASCHDLFRDRNDPTRVASCTESGCHEDPDALSPFHATVGGVSPGDCGHCHQAHTFRVPQDGRSCSVCHLGGGDRVAWAGGRPLWVASPPGTAFRHDDHPLLACENCHGAEGDHATLRIGGVDDCRSCHHTGRDAPPCESCHDAQAMAALDLHVSRSLAIRIGSLDRPVRWLPFDHETHAHTACQVCHGEGLDRAADDGADCSGCHAEHHGEMSDCSLCHARPADGAHDIQAHLGCAGEGCHDAPEAIRGAPRTRALCLACHRELKDHEPGRDCASCHILPEPVIR